MEKPRQWFSGILSPQSRPRTPPPASDHPSPIHWSPYIQLHRDDSIRPMPELAMRKRLVRLPTGDDVVLIGEGSPCTTPSLSSSLRLSSRTSSFLSTAPSSARRNLNHAFASDSTPSTPGSGPATRAWPRAERKRSETPPPPVPPLLRLPLAPLDPAQGLTAVPAALRGFLARGTPSPADYAAIRQALLAQANDLRPPAIQAFAHALATQVLAAARPASRGMAQLVEGLLRPLDTGLRPEALGALLHGLAQACVTGAGDSPTPEARRKYGVARDLLSRQVAQSCERVGPVRHAVQVCALARVAGPGEAIPFDRSPQGLGRLLAHNPLAALWHQGGPGLDDAQRLDLFRAALHMPPGVTSRAHAERLRDRILVEVPSRLQGVALACLLDASRAHVTPGRWPMARISAGVANDMAQHLLEVGVSRYVNAVDAAVQDAARAEASALARLGRDQLAVEVDTPRGRELAFDEEGVLRAADALLQGRQAAALAQVVDDLVWCFTRFDASTDPVSLRGRALVLRQMEVPAARPEAVVVARALADALDRMARRLSAPPSPDPL